MSPRRTKPDLRTIPVEPLDDVTWQRIERRLFAELADRPAAGQPAGGTAGSWRRRAAYGAAAAAVAAAVLLVLSLRGDERRAGGGGEMAGAAKAEPRAPSRIATAEAPSAVSLGDVGIDVAAHSALVVDDDRAGGLLLVLERGKVTCRVAPRAARSPVVVLAGDVRIEVVGTHFSVEREGDSARVEVHTGVVRVLQAGREVQVVAGESWPAAVLAPAPPAPAIAEPAPPKQRPVAPAPATKRPAPRAPATKRPAPATTRPPAIQPAGPRPGDDGGAHPPVRDRPRSAMMSAQQRYEAAARAEATDPNAALATYRELAAGSGPWASNALFAAARLEFELKRMRAARRLLTDYLRRYPTGPNAEDARQLLRQLR